MFKVSLINCAVVAALFCVQNVDAQCGCGQSHAQSSAQFAPQAAQFSSPAIQQPWSHGFSSQGGQVYSPVIEGTQCSTGNCGAAPVASAGLGSAPIGSASLGSAGTGFADRILRGSHQHLSLIHI